MRLSQAKPHEWRRLVKTLTALEFIVKNGSPHALQVLKGEVYKIRSCASFSYVENGKDQGATVRSRAELVADLLQDDASLQRERMEAFQYRKKFYNNGPSL